MTVADVKAQLIRDGDDTWQQVLGAPNILCAVNYEVVGPAHLVKHSDEIAFYPPVTGG